MSNSSVTNNSATLAAGFPSSVGMGVARGRYSLLPERSGGDGQQYDDFRECGER